MTTDELRLFGRLWEQSVEDDWVLMFRKLSNGLYLGSVSSLNNNVEIDRSGDSPMVVFAALLRDMQI